MDLEPDVFNQILRDWRAAPYGMKSKIVNKWAEILNCSYDALYRQLDIGRKRRKGDRLIEHIEDYVRIIFQIKKKPPEQHGEVGTGQAVRIAIDNGLVPGTMKRRVSTIDRIGRELGFNKKVRRVSRFQASYANELHHVDASSSKCFYIKRSLPDGDYLLKLHAGKKGYKNKPIPIRLRPWVYGIVDDYSGFYAGRYLGAFGETAIDNLDFLAWAWGKNNDKPFFGLPEKLKGDLGPMMRGGNAQDFFTRLGIKIDPSEPENKNAHGKIERPWRSVWQRFEKIFFVQTDWRKFEISLSELNRQFLNFQEEYNEMSHRFETGITRLQAWKRVNLRGGAVALPEKALATVAKRIERTVGADGCISINNIRYEVKNLHNAKVRVYLGVFDDRVVVEDNVTGLKYEVENFVPNPTGTFKTHKDTPHQKVVKESQTLEVTSALYENQKDQGNITHFPTKIKEVRGIENPLDTDTYTSFAKAMTAFISLSGISLNKTGDYELVKRFIMESGFNKRKIKERAFEVQDELEKRRIGNG